MSHEIYESAMRRALELALLGPAWGVNPQVGCVILSADGQIIAEGWHKGAGTPHAEVDALSKLDNVPAGATAIFKPMRWCAAPTAPSPKKNASAPTNCIWNWLKQLR